MKHLSQQEIIEATNFWKVHKSPILKGIGRAVGGAYRAAKETTKYMAPDIYEPLHRGKEAAKNIAGAGIRGLHGTPDHEDQKWYDKNIGMNPTTSKNVADAIKLGLETKGYTHLPKYGIHPYGVNPKNGFKVYRVRVKDDKNNISWLTVDASGEIVNMDPALDRIPN